MGIRKGDLAPDFSLRDQEGATIRLSDYRGKKNVVLYFYPKDETPGCTTEACTFRDHFSVFSDAGAVVIGVSADSPESHRRFAARHQLPFRLLTDEGHRVAKSYGVYSILGLLTGRVTYVIDKKGVVRLTFSSQFQPKKHVAEALEILKQM